MRSGRRTALFMVTALVLSYLFTPYNLLTKAATKLSTKSTSVEINSSKTITMKKAPSKVKWSVSSGAEYIQVVKKTKNSIKVKGVKKGTAKIVGKVAKKSYTCTVKVTAKSVVAISDVHLGHDTTGHLKWISFACENVLDEKIAGEGTINVSVADAEGNTYSDKLYFDKSYFLNGLVAGYKFYHCEIDLTTQSTLFNDVIPEGTIKLVFKMGLSKSGKKFTVKRGFTYNANSVEYEEMVGRTVPPTPTRSPSSSPTPVHSATPSQAPTKSPAQSPSVSPSGSPSGTPAQSPTPTVSPSQTPASGTDITTADQLLAIGGLANSGKVFKLKNNISMAGRSASISEFYGSLDGNGFKITGLERPLVVTNKGKLTNVVLEGVNITEFPSRSMEFPKYEGNPANPDVVKKNMTGVAALAMQNYGIIEKCTSAGKIAIDTDIVGDDTVLVAGITCLAANGSEVKNCTGAVDISLKNIYTNKNGTVTSLEEIETAYVGGVTAKMEKAEFLGNANKGNLSAKVESGQTFYIGGVLAEHVGDLITVSDLTNTGSISVAQADNDNETSVVSGGIMAYSDVVIRNCTNSGNLIGAGKTGGMYGLRDLFGGIVGMTVLEGAIDRCVNNGNITLEMNAIIGGIVGYSHKSVVECCNTGKLSAMTAFSIKETQSEDGAEVMVKSLDPALGEESHVFMGGIVGSHLPNDVEYIAYCHNRGELSIINSSTKYADIPDEDDKAKFHVGGIVGSIDTGGSVASSYNEGMSFSNAIASMVSGEGKVESSYYLDSKHGVPAESDSGVALTDAEALKKSSFGTFFIASSSPWSMDTKKGPYLTWMGKKA